MNNKDTQSQADSVGLVTPEQMALFTEFPLLLECGTQLGPITVEYETYGKLNPAKDNAILVCHALSGDAHAAGYHAENDKKPGWWDTMIGPGKAFDTDRYFLICSNFLGSCNGTTGPSSINPTTGAPYGMTFPMVTVKDMVKVQHELINNLGIEKLLSVTGGSMGGMQALEWTVTFPDKLRSVIPVATTHRTSAQSIAFNEVGRQAIFADNNWFDGKYQRHDAIPTAGLSTARMIGHITYLSEPSMQRKFGRTLKGGQGYKYDFSQEFQVESYLHHQGTKFTHTFDANTYLYITKAMDYFDLTMGYRSLTESMKRATNKFLLIAFSGDWLFPPYQMKEIANALRKNGTDVTYVEIQSDYGHDAFLLETEAMTKLISAFLHFTHDDIAAINE